MKIKTGTKLIFLTLLVLLMSGCASTSYNDEGGIGGTGHSDECSEKTEKCNS